MSAATTAAAPSGPRQITVEQFHAECQAQGVSAYENIAFVCVICGTVQSIASLVLAGATPEEAERMVGFSCEGRLTKAGPWPSPKKNSADVRKRRQRRGCDWTLGGLFRVHKLEIVIEGEPPYPRFELATPEQARDLERTVKARGHAGSETERVVRIPDADSNSGLAESPPA